MRETIFSLLRFFVFTLIGSLVFALLYIALPKTELYQFSINGENSYFHFSCSSFFESFYYSLVTMTTLGYGDIYPVGIVSRILAGIQPVFGLFFVGWLINDLYKRYVESENDKRNIIKIRLAREAIVSSLDELRNAIRDLRTLGAFLGEDDVIKGIKPINTYKVSDLGENIFAHSNLDVYFGFLKIQAYSHSSEVFKEKMISYSMMYDFSFNDELQSDFYDLLKTLPFNDHSFKNIWSNIDGRGDDWIQLSELIIQYSRIESSCDCFGKFNRPVCNLYKVTKEQEVLIDRLIARFEEV